MRDTRSAADLTREFHDRFGRVVRTTPTEVPADERELRVRLLVEELVELVFAMHGADPSDEAKQQVLAAVQDTLSCAQHGEVDLHEVMLETADLLIVTYGAALHYGFDADQAAQVKHASNLSKLGDDGRPVTRPDGKVLKGPNFRQPDRSQLPPVN
jgi:predicted HAD superfamily Cof-like phosphohydrolase